jgi:hypothetical protein
MIADACTYTAATRAAGLLIENRKRHFSLFVCTSDDPKTGVQPHFRGAMRSTVADDLKRTFSCMESADFIVL